MLSAMVGRCTPRSNLSLTNRAQGERERGKEHVRHFTLIDTSELNSGDISENSGLILSVF